MSTNQNCVHKKKCTIKTCQKRVHIKRCTMLTSQNWVQIKKCTMSTNQNWVHMGQFGQFGSNGFKRGQTHFSQLHISLVPERCFMGHLQLSQCLYITLANPHLAVIELHTKLQLFSLSVSRDTWSWLKRFWPRLNWFNPHWANPPL